MMSGDWWGAAGCYYRRRFTPFTVHTSPNAAGGNNKKILSLSCIQHHLQHSHGFNKSMNHHSRYLLKISIGDDLRRFVRDIHSHYRCIAIGSRLACDRSKKKDVSISCKEIKYLEVEHFIIIIHYFNIVCTYLLSSVRYNIEHYQSPIL